MKNKTEIIALMKSVQTKYFPELTDVIYDVEPDHSFDGVMGRAIFGKIQEIVLHYSDERILEPKYRMGLVPVISHELAHYLNPVDPECVMRERLPPEMMVLWEELLNSGYAQCSMTKG